MTSSLQTPVDRGYATPETRADAIRYLVRTGNEDLLPILGLAGEARPSVIEGRQCCPSCKRPYRRDGRTSCRWRDCDRGPASRGGER